MEQHICRIEFTTIEARDAFLNHFCKGQKMTQHPGIWKLPSGWTYTVRLEHVSFYHEES